jgi:hypothetical protein
MNKKEFFTSLIFVLIIGIIFICQDLSKGATIMSFIIGFIVLRNHLHIIADKEAAPIKETTPTKETFAEIPSFDAHQKEEYSANNNPLMRYASHGRYERMEGDNANSEKSNDEAPLKDEHPVKSSEKKLHQSEKEYRMHESYATPYEDPHPIISLTQPIIDSSYDSANTMQVRARTRDKRCLTGAVIKDANFYKKHYGDEFETSENLRWWGNQDY